uniref:Extended synaptotagmin-like protein 1a n=1 Tax=Mastacembelus armatus TaxID=205130 RepID=A0A7N9AUH8_9TELE
YWISCEGGLEAEPALTGPGLSPVSPSQGPGERAVSALWSFGKYLGALLPVYLAGYYGFTIFVVLFGLMLYMGWKHSRLEKVMRLQSAMYLLENEKEFTTEKVFRAKRDLPSWVRTRVHMFSAIIQQAWPFIGQYLEKLLVETIAPAIRMSSIHLQTLSFTKVNIGEKALKVVGVKAHTEHDKRQVMLDLYLSYAGDVEVNVEIKKYFCKAGVKGIQLNGKLRVILEPLIGDAPLVGAITMFFIRRPKLDINWTGLTNLLDIPGLSAMSDTMIMDAIASHLVLPNRLTVPLVADLHVAQLRSPLPRVTRICHSILAAEDLTAKDTVIKGLIDGKSDPYAVLRVGTQIFTSRHVDSNLNPQWREMYEVIVHEVPGQELEVEVFDKDPDQDDFLGRYLCFCKQWFNLKDVPSGSVHLRLEWLSLLSSADRLSEVIQKNQNLTSKTTEAPSAAILAVYLDQAYELPMRKGNKDPSPMVQISIQDTTKESKICYGTSNPVWEDAFTFFIQDPRKQDIDIQVKDDDRSLSLGSLTIPLTRVLASPDLTMDQWFQLENSGSASRIYVKTVLRVLWLADDATPTTPSPRPSSSGSGPGQTEAAIPSNMHCGTVCHPLLCTQGVLRIHLVEAQNLIAKDNFMGGMVKGKSDPYVKIRVAGITFRSHTIKENLNPVWNELYEVILTQLPGQEIQFELFDKDIDQDDFLGRYVLALAQFIDMWYTLNDVKSGRVHLVLEWLPRVTDLPRLEQVSSALALFHLFVFLHIIIQKSLTTCVVAFSIHTDMIYVFYIYICVCVCVCVCVLIQLSHSWGQALGSLTLPLREVLAETGLVLDRWLSLDGALPESQILLRATLKVLTTCCVYTLQCVCMSCDLFFTVSLISLASDSANTAGQVKLTISYSAEESRLFITVHSCRALAACSKDGADPYVSFILLPDKKATTKRKTATKKRDLNPEFNERFDFEFSLEESVQRRLDLSVKNSVSFMSRERELIGKLQLDLDQIDLKSGVTQW